MAHIPGPGNARHPITGERMVGPGPRMLMNDRSIEVLRKIVHIDEEKCDGCGQCVPACAEGAMKIVNGKARLIADRLCDGLGACLGECPRGAIQIIERESDPFDEQAVAEHLSRPTASRPSHPGGCPSAAAMRFETPAKPEGTAGLKPPASTLSHWPVQLHLLPPTAPFLKGADLLLCATCVPVALASFQRDLLAGRAVAVACPKLDNPTGYVEKLATMMSAGGVAKVTDRPHDRSLLQRAAPHGARGPPTRGNGHSGV